DSTVRWDSNDMLLKTENNYVIPRTPTAHVAAEVMATVPNIWPPTPMPPVPVTTTGQVDSFGNIRLQTSEDGVAKAGQIMAKAIEDGQRKRDQNNEIAFANHLRQQASEVVEIPAKSNMAFTLCWPVTWRDSVQIFYKGQPLLLLRRR